MGKGKVVGMVSSAAVVTALLTPAANAEPCSPIAVPTLTVDVSTAKRTYSLGDTVKLQVRVTRGAAGTELNGVEDAEVLGTALGRNFVLGDDAVTGAGGMAEVLLDLDRARPGTVDVKVSATREVAHCVAEVGEVTKPKLFRIAR